MLGSIVEVKPQLTVVVAEVDVGEECTEGIIKVEAGVGVVCIEVSSAWESFAVGILERYIIEELLAYMAEWP